jgi:REG-2-like HAD superfamily hydrolase
MMARFKAVFLDVGGTLLYMGDPVPVYHQLLREHGHDLDEDSVRQALTAAREAAKAVSAGPRADYTIVADQEFARRDCMVCELLDRLGVKSDSDACREAIWSSWLSAGVFHQYPETASVLARLKDQGYVVGAISNWEPRLEALLANHGLRAYFDFILASEAEGHVKPASTLFRKALELADVAPNQAIHVGDSYQDDVQGAQAVGLNAVLLGRDGGRLFDYSPAIRSLDELFALLEASEWIQGRVVGGDGRASGFTQLPWVQRQVDERLGFAPYPGTLNLKPLSEADRDAFERLKCRPGVKLEPEPGFCAARCFPVVVETVAAAIVLPEVPDYPPDRLELLAPVHLRDELALNDGCMLTVAVTPEATQSGDLESADEA